MTTEPRPNAPLITGLGALIAIALALPLLAPSCSDFQPGVKTFAKGSLIIPMDVCYQYQTDQVRTSYTPSASCPGAVTENGDVIKAYGLVYQLIRNGVAVYWIINPDKGSVTPAQAALTTPDLTLQFNAGFPVLKYDWTPAPPSVAPNTSNHTVKYLGGPFIIDGSDAVRAGQVLQKYKTTFRPTATTGVNVHVSNIAFTANVAKMLAGGWSAGGATPPKLALLNIGSSGAGSKNSEVVIRGYLQKAGLDIAEPDPANPTVLLAAGGSATGVHGTIYDRLVMEDFIPTTAGNVLTTNLFRNGYQILWVPHWAAPSSCSDCPPGTTCTCANKYPAATIQEALRTIGAFGASGKDIFAECAGLGSFEGVIHDGTGLTSTYGTAVAETHFQTVIPSPLVGALDINSSAGINTTPIYQPGNFASPLMQLGDYPFIPRSGAIENYKPASAATGYINVGGATDNTARLISETNGGGAYDIFTHRPGLKPGHGTFVYLGGHSYSGTDGSFEVGGTRLVLNTLFNLGAGCTESGVACDTGIPGVCAKGVFRCRADGTTYCAQNVFPSAETCNGLDDDCNGAIDDELTDPGTGAPLSAGCYTGPAGSRNVGICHGGARSCVKDANGVFGLTACEGQVTPQAEECNGLDDNCNGVTDESLTRGCYGGDVSTIDPVSGLPVGACKAGVETCNAGNWGECRICSSAEAQQATPPADCQILPRADDCTCAECGSGGKDWNCDGQVGQCGTCTPGNTQPCYTGPAGTSGVGPCHGGTQTCVTGGNWGACSNQVVPVAETCGNGLDDNCNGTVDESSVCGECAAGAEQDCYTYVPAPGDPPIVFHDPDPASPAHASICQKGTRACGADLKWGACGSGKAQTFPGVEVCNGLDDNCNGTTDDGAQCGPGFACRNGVCVYDSCGAEIPCAEGYSCVAGHCQLTTCGGVTCATGSTCHNGTCVDPNAGLDCGPGSFPAGGFCTGGACYEAGCAGDTVCQGGTCVADPCGGLICPGGTFCRQGDCVQACAFLTCGASQRCDVDGTCVADPCAGKTCNPTQTCVDGSCVADPCAGIGCGRGQACVGGQCVDDPCAGIACPAGQCQAGQCYSTGSTAGELPHAESSGCGCATGGAGTPLALLALLALAPLARRRRRPARGGAALLGLLVLAAASSGCKTETPFDPASCTGIGATVAACPGEDRCVDVAFDPSHCGSCDKACGAGDTCVDSGCFPASSVAPFIAAVSPVTLSLGGLTPVKVDISGQRFDASATVRATHLDGTTTYAANVIDAGHLSALIDLRGAQPDTWKFRVVNSDRVISNQKQVPVLVPTPAITGLTPASAEIGGPLLVHVEGTGLMVNSLCFFGSTTVPERALPATLTTTGLDCQLDLSASQPGPYQVWVGNPTGAASPLLSNRLAFSATSNAAPTLESLSPSAAKKASIKPLTVSGTGFDVTSRVYFVVTIPPAGPVDVPQVTSFVTTNQLSVGALDLTLCPGPISPCPSTGEGTAPGASYAVKVKSGPTGTVQTTSLPFVISTNPPEISSLLPAFAYQGEVKPVVVQGLNIPAGTVVQLARTGGAFADVPTAAVNATAATGTFDLKGTPPGSVPAGSYQVRLRLPAGAGYSSSLPFNVISNTAILQSVVPASGTQGVNPVTVTFSTANLRPLYTDVRVVFSAQPNQLLATSGTSSPFTASLDLRGLDTGLYTLQVKNPDGAALSNTVNFTVKPGPPTLTSVSPSTTARQVNRVPVVVSGTNFARPDTSGANGSTIHVFANCTPVIVSGQVTGCTCTGSPCIPDQVLPPAYNTVTVTSSTRIDVQFDTTSAALGTDASGNPVATTYSLWVWNPGGSPWQRSNQLTFTITP